MTINKATEGILADELSSRREGIIDLLKKAHFSELEMVANYVTNSTNPDGVRAREIKEAFEEDVEEELGHARQFVERIKELYGVVPSSVDFSANQHDLQPPEAQTDVAKLSGA